MTPHLEQNHSRRIESLTRHPDPEWTGPFNTRRGGLLFCLLWGTSFGRTRDSHHGLLHPFLDDRRDGRPLRHADARRRAATHREGGRSGDRTGSSAPLLAAGSAVLTKQISRSFRWTSRKRPPTVKSKNWSARSHLTMSSPSNTRAARRTSILIRCEAGCSTIYRSGARSGIAYTPMFPAVSHPGHRRRRRQQGWAWAACASA